jgi:WD40 repeat protein
LTHSATTSFLRDAQRFILAFQNILRQAPLQTYSSALTFAPESSIVRTTFKDVTPTWVELLVGKQRDWSACRSTLEGHTNQLTSINFSPDGKVLASGSGDKSIRIWDVSTGSCRSIMTGHRSWVNAVAFSSDGSLIASASRDETIRLWSTNTWSHKATLHGHTESVETLAWSQDCQLIASGSHDKTVKLWDVDKQSCYATLEVHTNLPRVAVSPDNRLVASTYDGNSIRIWDVTTMLCHNIIDGYSPIHSISFSQDSQALAVVLYFWTEDEEFDDRVSNLRLFNVETGQNYSSFYAGLETRFVAFSSNSDTVILVDSNTLHLWDYRTGVCHTKLEGCTQPGFRAAISPDEMSVATLHLDNIVKIWDVAATDIVHECDLGPSTTASEVSWDIVASPDDKLFIFYSSRKVLVWDSTTGALIGTLDYAINVNDPNKMQYDILDLKFSPDGRILAYTSKLENKIEVRLLDTQTWLDCTFFDHTYRFHKVQFSQDGELLLSTSHDGTVRLWNIEHGSCISMLNSDYRRWDPFCLSQNNKLVALGSDMGFVRLWNVATGSVKTLAGHTSSLVTSAFSADARLLASGSHDVTIRIWHVDTGSCRVLLEDVLGHYMGKVAFSSDSKLLASFHSFESIRLWDTKNGQCRHIFNNYDDFVMDFVFSSCGTYLQTSRGNLSIPVSAMDSHLSEAQQPPLIFVDQRWIYLNQTPIFWLPPEYSAEKIQVSGSTIGIVNEEGETIILRLCLDVLKRIEPRLFQSTNARDDIAV